MKSIQHLDTATELKVLKAEVVKATCVAACQTVERRDENGRLGARGTGCIPALTSSSFQARPQPCWA